MLLFMAMEETSWRARRKYDIDETLFTEIASGDNSAFETLYFNTYQAVYAYILSFVKNKEDAEDIMQDTYIKIRMAAHLYEPLGKPMAWIFTIAKNLSLMHFRKKSRESDLNMAEMENCLDFSCMNHIEERLVLEAALNLLSQREHQIILLHAMSGWKHREIADYMGLSVSNVIKTYNRSIKKLQKYLEEGQAK